jgi:Fic family protein
MARFFQWRDSVAVKRELHPLVTACHATVYFLHIHPFNNGNGRVSRLMIQDYLIRRGYVPVVIKDLERKEYIRMISDAEDCHPEDFVGTMLNTQLEMLQALNKM